MDQGYDNEYIIAHTDETPLFANQSIPLDNVSPRGLSATELVPWVSSFDLERVHPHHLSRWVEDFGPINTTSNTAQIQTSSSSTPISLLHMDYGEIPSISSENFKDWFMTESRRQIELAYICFSAYFTTDTLMMTHMIVSTQQP